ncbi:hypothetical protein [uncultured Enterococcus sp.]|uniref:hypothetical protein n=1 Tax=uncultured Enterococcus sp. TaxID=167972 RepID=UPI002AA7066A|nr:hypothetical protein [uncultured Enterococcus sp.]
MKKKMIMGTVLMLGGAVLFSGCSGNDEKTGASKESSTIETSVEQKSNDTEETTRSESSVSEGEAAYPYEVSLNVLSSNGNFYKEGMNIPQSINVSFTDGVTGVVDFITSLPDVDYQTSYTVTYQQIPTKTIRVTAGGENEIREVSVNTELVLGEMLQNDNNNSLTGNLYVFTNNNGGVSLATPNYAGNMPAGSEDVMLEYLVR